MKTKFLISLLSAGGIVLTATGCGNLHSAQTQAPSSSTAIYSAPGTPVTFPSPAPSTAPSPMPSLAPASPPMTFRIAAVGYTTTSIQVPVGTVLKVKFTPGKQDTPVAGTGYYAQYSHLGVYITVGTSTQATPMLDNGYVDGKAQTSPVMDFSGALDGTCTAANPACRRLVTITISKPNNDYYCLNYGMYCSWAQVYQTHPWNGTLTIQTDDTSAI